MQNPAQAPQDGGEWDRGETAEVNLRANAWLLIRGVWGQRWLVICYVPPTPGGREEGKKEGSKNEQLQEF